MTLTLGTYSGLSWRFSVRCPDGALARELTRILSCLMDPLPTQQVATYSVVLPARGESGRLELDGQLLVTSKSEWVLMTRLLQSVNNRTIAVSSEYVLLHAAAAERGGRAVVICAPSESGKTTLVSGLVRAGMRYLTDEAVALRPGDGSIVPYPKALSIDAGSWPVLADLKPSTPGEAKHLGRVQWHVRPADIREDAVSDGALPAVVVLPRYESGVETRLTAVTPGQALIDLLQQTFHLSLHRERDMTALARLLPSCSSYRLAVGDLATAVSLVDGLL